MFAYRHMYALVETSEVSPESGDGFVTHAARLIELLIDMEIVKHEKLSKKIGNDLLEIVPLGGGSEVGRSCILVKFKGKLVMVD